MVLKMIRIAFIILLGTASLNAQEFIKTDLEKFCFKKDGCKDAQKNLKQGDILYLQGMSNSYILALDFYLKSYAYNPNDASLNYKLGICYIRSSQAAKSLKYLQSSYDSNKEVAPDIAYWLGVSYQQNYRFRKAKEYYSVYRRLMSKEKKTEQVEKVKKRIQECENGLVLLRTPQKAIIENLGPNVNSAYTDYGPVISADESVLIFTSRRPETTGGGIDISDNGYYEDIYSSENISGKWNKAANLGENLNTKLNDAAMGLSPDAQELFIFKGRNGGDINISKLKGDQWSKPSSLPSTINTPDWESAASLSYDGKTLYFVSDNKDKSLGGADIYLSKKQTDGSWGPAQNLGNVINTPEDELGVFILPDDRTIYFSSNGHKSMGGLDIFRSILQDNGKWSKPENVGYPINTPDNDLFFVVSASGKTAYYSTVREDSYGFTDIYKIKFLDPRRQILQTSEDNLLACLTVSTNESVVDSAIKLNTVRLTIVKGTIIDENSKQPLEATIEIIDNDKNQVIFTTMSNSKTGKYLVSLPSGKNYAIVVKKPGYMYFSENFNLPQATSYQEVVKDVPMSDVVVGAKTVLKNLFFDLGVSNIRPESSGELNRMIEFLKEYPTIRIEISGHTDNTGSEAFNNKLSTDRAKAIVDYLIQRGISSSRLEAKGYGWTKPVATNDTEEGRQQNRRVEFKILSK